MKNSEQKLFVVSLRVGEVPANFYKQHGQREIAYTRELIRKGTVRELFVTPNRKQSWLLLAVDDEAQLTEVLDGFPLRPYFTLEHHEVRDVGADVRAMEA